MFIANLDNLSIKTVLSHMEQVASCTQDFPVWLSVNNSDVYVALDFLLF